MALETFLSTNLQVQFETTDFSASDAIAVGNRAQAMLPLCETDLATQCRWFGVDPSSSFGPFNRVVITLNGVRGGSNTGYSSHQSQMQVNPELGSTTDFVVGIFAEEMIEILMSLKGGWHAGFSDGEGLSRVAGDLLHPNAGLSSPVNAWLVVDPTTDPTAAVADTVFRQDWVSVNFEGGPLKAGGNVAGDQDSYSVGCSMLFIFYLKDQLGFTMSQICQKGRGTLSDTYNALTGSVAGAFDRFKRLMDFNFPPPTNGITGFNPFPLFLLHTGTPILPSDANNGNFLMLDNPSSHVADLYFVKRRNTGTNSIEVHVLSGVSNYQQFSLHTGTALSEQEDANGDFLLAYAGAGGAPDLYYIKRRNTGSGRIEVHVLSAASNYQQFVAHIPTALLEADDPNGDFALAQSNGSGRSDLYFIKRRNTGSGQIEVHVLSAASNYQQFLLHAPTALLEADSPNGGFALAPFNGDHTPDLYFIKTSNTGTSTVEVHVLTGTSNFQQFALHTPSLILETDASNGNFVLGDYDGDGEADLCFIKFKNAGTNSVEVHFAPIPRSTSTN
jgi:hypothetical protein